ncbi:hypothetical protein AGABI2DRAFT_63301 [Agaricus bisporus var. bisporus H97]|uniref:hypothetical protein n=1 Tax=Agaricus bisporus var. bisporus (strain H97 / ATCC MYA-4626 / FGSC 10389) TaxID=936046 RepID=UPI00029F68A5|nr:hypothetical protein AGABI2DRAFT_63301 [Agaricus bisporus var. bisporus H97]EKV50410.1 hypothetical protein AGABI2DRAFT_63301 [Agaricus bisporus var. bisporus H97]
MLSSTCEVPLHTQEYHPPRRSSSPPAITHHPHIIPHVLPTNSLIHSMAGAAHYSGGRVDNACSRPRRRSTGASMSLESHADLKEEHARVLKDLIELFSGRPTLEIFDRSWSKDADPFATCKGYDEYVSQAKRFSKSTTKSTRIMSSTSSPNRLIYYQVQEYVTRIFGIKRVIVVVDMDEECKIRFLSNEWQGQNSKWNLDFIAELVPAKVLPWLVHTPKQSH